MNTNINISVIIACYNVEKYLVQCLDSIINQTYKNLEIIAVNDGSTDSTLSILKQYQSQDARIIVIDQKNQGLSGARNSGISIATGEYLLFIDSDDWINVETIEISVASLLEKKSDLVFFSYTKEYENKSIEKFILPKSNFYNANEVKLLHQRIFGLSGQELSSPEHADSLVTAWGKLYITAIITENNIRFVDCKHIGTEDMLFNVYYFYYIKSASYLHKCLYHYRKNNNSSLTSVYKTNFKQQWNNLFGLVQDFITEKKLGIAYQQAFNNRVAMSIVSLGLNELYAKNSVFEKINRIDAIISNPDYAKNVKHFQTAYLPIHWKIFFVLIKNKFATGVYLMLRIMRMIIEKNN